jgi:hypothetical protein
MSPHFFRHVGCNPANWEELREKLHIRDIAMFGIRLLFHHIDRTSQSLTDDVLAANRVKEFYRQLVVFIYFTSSKGTKRITSLEYRLSTRCVSNI